MRCSKTDTIRSPHRREQAAMRGTSRPSNFAVFKLTIVWYFTGACTGRSAGFHRARCGRRKKRHAQVARPRLYRRLASAAAAGAGNHRRNDIAGITLQRSRHVVKRGRRRRDEDNIGGKKLFIVGHPARPTGG